MNKKKVIIVGSVLSLKEISFGGKKLSRVTIVGSVLSMTDVASEEPLQLEMDKNTEVLTAYENPPNRG